MKQKQSINSVDLSPSTPLKTLVWRVRVKLRDIRHGKDAFAKEIIIKKPASYTIQKIYRKADEFIQAYMPNMTKRISKKVAYKRVRDAISEMGYSLVEINETKPWGAYYRLANNEAERFVQEFFPGLSINDAKLGRDDTELSPKFLLVKPGQRLSWQLHYRRAERWRFLTKGAYHKSGSDIQGRRHSAQPDDIVQFEKEERHRLSAFDDKNYTLVAEIWQHTDPAKLSDEDDIVRLQDDYSR